MEMNEINLLELPKLKKESDGTNLYNWLSFLRSETEEEFEMVTESNPKISKAYAVLKELSEDEKTRLQVEAREKYRRDVESYIEGARKEAILKGRQEGRQEGRLEGRQEGRLEGRQEGRLEGRQEGIIQGELKGKQEGRLEGKQEGRLEGKQEGIIEGKRDTAINLLRMNIPIEMIVEATKLTVKEIEELKEKPN